MSGERDQWEQADRPSGQDGTPSWAYNEDGYCVCCGNGHWKHHMPECTLRDALDLRAGIDVDILDRAVAMLRDEWQGSEGLIGAGAEVIPLLEDVANKIRA